MEIVKVKVKVKVKIKIEVEDGRKMKVSAIIKHSSNLTEKCFEKPACS